MPPFCLIDALLTVVYMQRLLAPWRSTDWTLLHCSLFQLQSHCSRPGDQPKPAQEMAIKHRQHSVADMGWPVEKHKQQMHKQNAKYTSH